MNLPLELYGPIFQYVSAGLLNLLLVSRSFRDEAERILYHKVTLRYHGKQWNELDIMLMQTLIRSERIASHVKILAIILEYRLPMDFSTEPDAHWRPAHQVLCAVKNLKNLAWRVDQDMTYRTRFYPSFSMLSGTSFQLERLPIFPFRDRTDRLFLEGQKNIIELGISGLDKINISRNALPNLAILTTYSLPPLNLVEGRPVRALKTFCFHPSKWPPSSSFESVKSLYLQAVVLDILPEILTQFPSLRYLRLDSHRFAPPSISLPTILTFCEQSPTLYKLHLSLASSPPEYTHTIFSSSSSLQRISFDYGSSSAVEWVKGATHAQHFRCGTFHDEWKDSRWSQPLP